MKPSELLRATKEYIVTCEGGYACIAMKDFMELESICPYDEARRHPLFIAARNYLWEYRTWDGCDFKDDPYFKSHEERIEGITRAIADAEAAGE